MASIQDDGEGSEEEMEEFRSIGLVDVIPKFGEEVIPGVRYFAQGPNGKHPG